MNNKARFVVAIIGAAALALMLTLTLVMLFAGSTHDGCSEGLGRQACAQGQNP